MVRRVSSWIVLVAACCVSDAAHADALQNQILAAARMARPDQFAFRQTVTIDRTAEPRKILVEQFDPARPVAERWTLLSVDAHAPTPKDLAESHKAKRGPVPSYGDLAKWFGAPATRSDTAPGYVTYRFARLPKGGFEFGSHDASADTQAEALVNIKGKVPFVERVRLTMTKGFSMMFVASIKSIAVDERFRQLPDNRVVYAASSSDITGAFLGKAGQMHADVKWTDFEPRNGS
jgi:hypothetical protein